jgi:peptide chain release factor 2
MGAPGFWDKSESAQSTVATLKSLKAVAAPLKEVLQNEEDLRALIEMAEEDDSLVGEVSGQIERLEQQLDDLETKALLSGEHDARGAIVTINARDGGTDANDLAEMMLRMYTLWGQ